MEIILKQENLTEEELAKKIEKFNTMEITIENVVLELKDLNSYDKDTIVSYYLTEDKIEEKKIIEESLKFISNKRIELFGNAILYKNEELYLSNLNEREKLDFSHTLVLRAYELGRELNCEELVMIELLNETKRKEKRNNKY